MTGRAHPAPARRLSARDLFLFAEATVLLAVASAAIALMPFRWVMKTTKARSTSKRRVTPERTVLAVRRASRRLPWKTMCFQEGLAALWMLRRRGIDARLHYGVRQQGEAVTAHVWVSVDGAVVIGEEQERPHALLGTFPEA